MCTKFSQFLQLEKLGRYGIITILFPPEQRRKEILFHCKQVQVHKRIILNKIRLSPQIIVDFGFVFQIIM